MHADDVKTTIRARYGQVAQDVSAGARACCGGAANAPGVACCGPMAPNLYAGPEVQDLPPRARDASLGCGNPTALAELRTGETVLDLGSGGGIDVLLSARRVGPTGKVYGLDMTDEMLALAEENRRASGLENVEFLRGDIEQIPLGAATVDVVISNCVINLSTDKDRVVREAFRVLKPGGRFAVSDVVARGVVPDAVRRSMELWIGCVGGALSDYEYVAKLARAGFEDIAIEPTRIYGAEDATAYLAANGTPDSSSRAGAGVLGFGGRADRGIDDPARPASADGAFMSAFVRARKPAASSCCASGCCA